MICSGAVHTWIIAYLRVIYTRMFILRNHPPTPTQRCSTNHAAAKSTAYPSSGSTSSEL